MLEILLNRTYKITSPVTGVREISFMSEFSDIEFDDWAATENSLNLFQNGQRVASLIFDGNKLSGRDTRGGYIVVEPQSNNVKQFQDYFRKPRKVSLSHSQSFRNIPEIKKNHTIAVLSKSLYSGVDNYKYSKFLKEDIDLMFTSGYNHVMVIDRDLPESSIKLLTSLTSYLNNEIGSVQVVSSTEGAADALQYESGNWSCFCLSSGAWSKIRKFVLGSTFNLETALTKAFNEKRLKRISTKMSRDVKNTPQDSKRKNFKMETANG